MRQAFRVLVLTDLVDSTKMVAALGDVRAGALNARVDRIARDLLAARGGLEIDKTDGFLMLFTTAPAALGFAVDLHDALATLSAAEALPLAMRIGVHAGTVGIRENPPDDVARGAKPVEVEGLAKPLAARVMSLAVGNQTLCTESIDRAVDHPESASLTWVDHGAWRLKGVPEPVRLAEVGRPGLAPLRPPPDSEKAWRASSGPFAQPREAARRVLANSAVRGLLLLGLAAIATASGAYWDHTRLKTREFARFEWSATGPVGVGDPQPLQPRYRVTTRAGLVRKLEHITAEGSPVAQTLPDMDDLGFAATLLDSARGGEPDWIRIDGWRSFKPQSTSVMEVARSDDGLPTELIRRHPAGAVQERALVETTADGLRLRWQTPYGVPAVSGDENVSVEDLRFDSSGLLAERAFLNISGLQPSPARNGAFGERTKRDEQGRVVSRTWLDAHGDPLDDTHGVAQVALAYHGTSTVVAELRTFNRRGEPVADGEGCAVLAFSANSFEQRCLDAKGVPALRYPRGNATRDLELRSSFDHPVRWHRRVDSAVEGGVERAFFGVDGERIATLRIERDADGHARRMSLVDPMGAPAPSDDVWSTVTLQVAPDGTHLASPRFSDVSGQPYLVRDGMRGGSLRFKPVHRRSFSYDDEGRLTAVGFLDLDDKPSAGAFGFSTIRATRDTAGRTTHLALFDPSGAPTNNALGVHRFDYVLDDLGRPTELARFAADDAPARDVFDTHRDVMQWDAHGRLTSFAAFGPDGPINRPDAPLRGGSTHRITIEYSPLGKASKLAYFTADGTPGRFEEPELCAAEQVWFDAAGNFSGTACFGPDGAPKTYRHWGFHKNISTYGPDGPTSDEYWDTEGNPTVNRIGCERMEAGLDARGRRIADRCLAADGEPMGIMGSDVVVMYLEYDDFDRVVLEEDRKRDGSPGSVRGAAASRRYSWNDRGELERIELAGEDGQPAENDHGAAVFEMAYDDKSTLARMVRRDANGEILQERGDVRVRRNGLGTPVEWSHHDRTGDQQWRLSIEVDAAQRTTEVKYVNSDGGPVGGSQGWASGRFRYAPGLVTAAYRGGDGAAARLRGPDHFQRGLVIKDERRREEDYSDWGFGELDTDVSPLPVGFTAWSGWRLELDSNDRPVARTYLDAEGHPVVPEDPGYATRRIEWKADAQVRIRYFDAEGEPMEVCGVAEVELVDGEQVARDLSGTEVDLPTECQSGRFGVRLRLDLG